MNDGKLMKPQVVLKEEDTNTGSQKNIGSEEVRQIVSSETSKELRDMLRSVVSSGTGRNAEVKGFSVGGKSGTSEPDYSDKTAEYIASFMGVAPTTDPEYAVLVVVRAPKRKVKTRWSSCSTCCITNIKRYIYKYKTCNSSRKNRGKCK